MGGVAKVGGLGGEGAVVRGLVCACDEEEDSAYQNSDGGEEDAGLEEAAHEHLKAMVVECRLG